MVLTEYARTKLMDEPLHEKFETVQQVFSIVSVDDTGIFELPNSYFSKQYKLSDVNFLGVTIEEQAAIIRWFSKVLETVPCRFSYIVANEYVDEVEFKNQVLYPLANDELDNLRHAFNRVIADKLTDAKQGLYQSIYFTLTCKADDMKDARTTFSTMDTAIRTAFIEQATDGVSGSVMTEVGINERMQLLYNFTHIGLNTSFKFDFDEEVKYRRDWLNTISPGSLRFENEIFYMNGKVGKVIYIDDYPRVLEADIISKLSQVNCTSYISVNNEILPTEVLKKELQRKHMKVGLKIENEKSRNRNQHDYLADASATLLASNKKIEDFEREIEDEDQKYFNTTITMLFMADDLEQLQSIENKIITQASLKSIQFKPCFAMQREGINTSLGLGIQEFKHVCNMSSTSVAMFMPYKTQELNDEGGVYYGINQLSKNAIFADKKRLKNRNSLILGQSGSGKSVAAKLETICSYTVYTDDQFLMIDPNADYFEIAGIVGGTVISFDPQKQLFVNPLDVDFTDVEYSDLEGVIYEKADFIQTLISSCIRRDLSEDELPVLNKAIEKVYSENYSTRRQLNGLGNAESEFVIPKHMRSEMYYGNEKYTSLSREEQIRQYSPTLQDIYQCLVDMNDFHAEHVAKMMDTFVNGALSLFNHRTNVDLNSRFISFDLSQTQENMRVTAMVVMMEMVRNTIRKNGRDGKWTHVYIDEFHELLGIECVAKFVLKLWKEVRKMSGLMTGITQNMSDLMRSENDMNLAQIFSNTESFFLLSQSTQDKELLMKFLPGISTAMFAYVDNAASGTGLLKMGPVTVPFDMVIKKNSEIYKLVNTDAGVIRGA
ncbi:hypothetical protein CSX00_02500 [Pseudobutyrivibrio ruminis]|uniref:TraG P-loop domain-containing protein n=1 Tax=Pseudobutyrivibrio ruminis TaxID=46206 RepID=A0A2G3EDJ8_9FIRM|nr:DUF87 domain-containing protein [Pseudobutyrivibrio ruminis]PHU41203.1 hypothetical protein CSX00_02500 [Pseudobutyrivibrio ruminis]